jgi:AraC-like DNA-binding protein
VTPSISYNPVAFEQTFPTLHILEQEYHKEEANYFVMRSLLESLIHYMIKLKSQSSQRPSLNCQRVVEIKKIIEHYYKEEKNIEFYARKMGLSAKRLNEISKKTTGKTVTQLIHHRLILEAKREMVAGTKTIQTISEELGFENASYFARFFKKQASISPTEFLKQLFK